MLAANLLRVVGNVGGFDGTVTVFTATSSGSSINYPTTRQAGDLAVLLSYVYNTTSTIPTGALATGYTNISNVTATNASASLRSRCMYRLLTGAEGASVSPLIVTTSGDADHQLMMFRFNVPVTAVTVAGVTAAAAYTPLAGPLSGQTITGASTTADAILSLAFGGDAGNGNFLPSDIGFTPAGVNGPAGAGYAAAKYRYELRSAAQNTSVSIAGTETFVESLQSFYFNLTP